MVLRIYLEGSCEDRHREQSCGQGRRRGWEEQTAAWKHIHYRKIDSWWEFAI